MPSTQHTGEAVTDLTTLLDRLQKAKEGSRELDAEIGEALGVVGKLRNVYRRGYYVGNDPVLLRVAYDFPPFSRSLDAALQLMPEEWTAWQLRSRGRKTRFVAELSKMNDDGGEDFVFVHGSTPALAMISVILKARLAQEQPSPTPLSSPAPNAG